MADSELPVINAQGEIFSSAKTLREWEEWARKRVEEGLHSPTLSHEEAMQRLEKAMAYARNKMV